MKLYKKTLLITGATLICLVMLMYFASLSILMSSFTRLEQQDTQKNIQRATMALSDDISALDKVVGDWAAWDETYAFIQDSNLSYIERNAPNATFIELNLNLMLFINSSGGIVYARGFDPQTGEDKPVPASLRTLPADNILLKHADKYGDVKGIILVPEGPMIVSSRPILDNERKKPILGSMIWGRYLGNRELQQLAHITNLSLKLYRFDDKGMPADFMAARNSFSKTEPVFVAPIDEQTIGGYELLNDIYGNPALVLRIAIPRAIYEQGKISVQYLLVSLLAIGIVFVIVTMLLLYKFVLARLAYLSVNVSTIGAGGDISKRVSMKGKDELSNLASDINRMLGMLERSQQQLQKSETSLCEAQRIACLGNWDLDIINNKLYWSDEIYRIFGLKPQEFGATYEAFLNSVHPDDRESVKKYVNDALYEKKPYSIDHRIVLPDGSVRTVHEQAEVTFDEKNKPVRMLGTVQDITERKQAEEKLAKLVDELKRSNAELEQFAYIASHDLQEPLRMVASYVQLLERRYKGRLDSDADDFIGFAVDGAMRMQNMINDLLQYSRVTTRGKPLEPTDCNAVLDSVLADMKIAVDESCAVITHDSLPAVFADSSQLERVLQNLIGNAIKFRSDEKPHIHIGVVKKQNEWLFSVKDNGIGLDMKQADHLFQMFQRLQGATKYQGTGMGLAICRKILERHGGRIWVESELCKGSTFYFTIPAREGIKS